MMERRRPHAGRRAYADEMRPPGERKSAVRRAVARTALYRPSPIDQAIARIDGGRRFPHPAFATPTSAGRSSRSLII